MNIEVVTKEDLQQLRLQLLQDFTALLRGRGEGGSKTYLRTKEVRALLKISAGTLQNLRIKGQLHPRKVGGSFYYAAEEIQSLLQGNASARQGQ